MSNRIRIIITGGTFDKEYNELTGELYFRDSHVPRVLKLGRARLDVTVRTIMLLDSNEMTDGDRETIAKNCTHADENYIVVTHGTDTMVETAEIIARSNKDKTVVLTGAMVPYTFGSSDGLFNLGSAIAFVQTLPAGVYIAMNGRYFTWDNVDKNKQIGEFQERQNKPESDRARPEPDSGMTR